MAISSLTSRASSGSGGAEKAGKHRHGKPNRMISANTIFPGFLTNSRSEFFMIRDKR